MENISEAISQRLLQFSKREVISWINIASIELKGRGWISDISGVKTYHELVIIPAFLSACNKSDGKWENYF